MKKNRRTEKHHFVPQFYLRHWCDGHGKLWVHPKGGAPAFRASPASFASVKGLYDTSAHPHLAGWDNEGGLSQIEGTYARVWPDIVERCTNPRTKRNIARFLALTHLRHPRQKIEIKETRTVFRDIASKLPPGQTSITLFGRNERIQMPVDELRAMSVDTSDSIDASFLHNMRASLEDLAEILFQRKWGVFVADRPVFVTGDSPLVLWKAHCRRNSYGFATPGTQVTMPLSPTKLLMIDDQFDHDAMVYPLLELENLNDGIIDSCDRFIFSRTERIERGEPSDSQ